MISNGNVGDQSAHSIYTNQGMTMYGAGFAGELSDSEIMGTIKDNGKAAKDPLVKSVKQGNQMVPV